MIGDHCPHHRGMPGMVGLPSQGWGAFQGISVSCIAQPATPAQARITITSAANAGPTRRNRLSIEDDIAFLDRGLLPLGHDIRDAELAGAADLEQAHLGHELFRAPAAANHELYVTGKVA